MNYTISVKREYGYDCITIEASWKEQAAAYYRWLTDYKGELSIEKTDGSTPADIYCPVNWTEPETKNQAKMTSRHLWLKNYLGKYYEDYSNHKETDEIRKFLTDRLWERREVFNELEPEFPEISYTNNNCFWKEITF